MKRVTLKISGMSCHHCEMRVTNALKGLSGVIDANVNLKEGSAEVTFDESSVGMEAITYAVQDAGYSVEE